MCYINLPLIKLIKAVKPNKQSSVDFVLLLFEYSECTFLVSFLFCVCL